jgi:hypothetical protein
MNKFEKLVEYIINEDEEKAQELFHEIVVEKSREIYNDLVSEAEDQTDDFVADIEADEYGTDMNMDDEDMDDEDMDDEDMEDMDDEDMDDMDDEDDELEDRVVDLEAELDALKAEFDAMMADEDDDGNIDGHTHEMEEELDMFEDDELDEGEEIVREYTEKVAPAKGEDHKATSTVAGKNDMGGTAKNLNQGGNENGRPAPKAQAIASGNKNVPGGKQGLEKA